MGDALPTSFAVSEDVIHNDVSKMMATGSGDHVEIHAAGLLIPEVC